MPTSLQGIAQKAASQKGYRFRNLYGMRDEDFLKQCWRDIRKDAASGVDQVSAQEYEQHLDANIHGLVERLKQKRYRATLVRRHYIPKGDGTQRPLGIPMACSYCISSPSGLGIVLAEAITLSQIDSSASSLRLSDTRDSRGRPSVARSHEAPKAPTETAAGGGDFTRGAVTCRRPSP